MLAASVERLASSLVICESRGLRLHSHSVSGAPAARSCSTTCITLSSISRKMISSDTDILSRPARPLMWWMMCITLSTTHAHFWCGPWLDATRNRSRAGRSPATSSGIAIANARDRYSTASLRTSSSRAISSSFSGSNSLSRRKRSTSAWSAKLSRCQSTTEPPRKSRRTASISASVSSPTVESRATRGRTVLTTLRVYACLPGLDSRNVAVNRLITPRAAITFPMTAIMYVLASNNAAMRLCVPGYFRRGRRASPRKRPPAPLPPAPASPARQLRRPPRILNPRPRDHVRPFRHSGRSVDRRDQAHPRDDRPRTRPALAAARARPARAALLRWVDLPPHPGHAMAAAARVLCRGDLPVPALGRVRDRVPARGLVVHEAVAADRLPPVLPDPARRQGVAIPAARLLLRSQPPGDAGPRYLHLERPRRRHRRRRAGADRW